MAKRFGFTLAEVLITLGIIGVVAAMTIPTLISNTNGAQFKSAYKKALSTLNQAILMNVALADTDVSTLKADTDGSGAAGTMSKLLGDRLAGAGAATAGTTFYNDIAPTAKDVTLSHTCSAAGGDTGCTDGDTVTSSVSLNPKSADFYIVSLADGTAFGYNKNATNCTAKDTANCYGFIDVNGATGPNKIIDCANTSACDSSEITDIFPVIFYGQTVEPATDSARAVLFGK